MLDELRSIKSGKKEIREFALTIGIIYLAILSWVAFIKGKDVGLNFFLGGGIFIALGFLAPVILKPFQKIWMGISIIIGFFMSRLILTILFYLVISPMGILTRILGKDILDQRIDPKAKSYWKNRAGGVKSKESYENQY